MCKFNILIIGKIPNIKEFDEITDIRRNSCLKSKKMSSKKSRKKNQGFLEVPIN
jgi:hypothetical protein